MFENYVGARTEKRRKWVTVLIAASVIVHAAAGTGLIVRSFWVIEKLPLPDVSATLGGAPPPPPPPPPAGSKKPETKTEKKKVKKVKDTVQPSEDQPDPQDVEVVESDTEGVEGGVEGGVAGGVVGGVIGGVEGGVLGGVGDAPPPPPPEPEEPKVVRQVALEAKRIAGEKNIVPPDKVKLQIRRDGKSRVMAVVKMCLTKGGTVRSLKTIKSSGYAGYDRKIKSKMRGWKYRPFKVNGKATAVCTSVTFIYSQSD